MVRDFTLWPRSPFTVKVLGKSPTIDPSTREPIGPGLLREGPTGWEIWVQDLQGFRAFNPKNASDLLQANMRARYGAGWEFGYSKGTSHGSELVVWWEAVNAGIPFPSEPSMEYYDLLYTSQFDELRRRYLVIHPDKPVDPPPPPPPPPARDRAIDFDFQEDLVIQIPRGATEILLKGTLSIPSNVPLGIKPLVKTALGAVEGQRVNAGLLKITRDQRFGIEWDPDKTKPVGNSKVGTVELSYQWSPGKVRVKIGSAEVRTYVTNTGDAAEGGVIVLGVDPGSDEYVRLIGGRFTGTLKITGGVQTTPIDPPPPPGDGLSLAREALATLAKLVKVLGG